MKPGHSKKASVVFRSLNRILTGVVLACLTIPATADQRTLEPVVDTGSETLEFDWPILRIGTGEYTEGPTGVTVFHFTSKVYSAIDVRGGGPGTVNAPYMQLGYEYPELDTIVFSGGSWYGLESVTAVASALKDDGIRDGNAFGDELNIAMSVGSIIFDFGSRRLNEIYPDKRLAQAAFRAARPGRFPQGAHGAGRFALTGSFFGCNAYSGQGGAFRQIGEVKLAAFAVVNAVGVVTRRDGTVVACYRAPGWPEELHTRDLFADFPASRDEGWTGVSPEKGNTKNTTVSLIVVNQRLEHSLLQRLAVQVHTSMARAIQPFASLHDGDVLYAVSTGELEESGMPVTDLGAIASELMWDAILSSVPEQPAHPTPAAKPANSASELRAFAGEYVFSPLVSVRIDTDGKRLTARASGQRPAYAVPLDTDVELIPVAANRFMVPGRYPLLLQFEAPNRLVINPGHWQQTGARR